MLRGLLIGVLLGTALAFAAQRAGLQVLPPLQLPGISPPASPSATPYPPLNATTSVQLVADRLPRRIAKLLGAGGVKGRSIGQGTWLVKWGEAEWQVDERTRDVTPLTDDARFFLNLPGP